MLSYIKAFIKRNRNKIIVVGVCFGGAMLATRYAQRRFIEWQEKETKEFLHRTRKQHYFESTEKTCNQTIIILSSTLRENIVKHVNCEEVIEKLKESPSNKIELWQELKVLVFTKVTLLIYFGALLVIALRVQLNIIGGHIYCRTSTTGSDSQVTNEVQEQYLAQCNYLLNESVKEVYPIVKEKVHCALKDITLKQNLTLQNIENILWAIQSGINNDEMNPFKNIPLLIYGSEFEHKDPFINDMLQDTFDLLQSSEVQELVSSCINRGFSHLIDKVSEFFLPDESNNAPGEMCSISRRSANIKFIHPNHISKPLAKIIPIVNGYGNPGSTDLQEVWISPFIYMEKVKTLGANIFESYSCPK